MRKRARAEDQGVTVICLYITLTSNLDYCTVHFNYGILVVRPVCDGFQLLDVASEMMAVLVCSKEKVDALSNPLHIRINMIDCDVILAVFANILSWIVAKWFPSWLPHLLPKIEEEDTEVSMSSVDDNRTRCIPIGRPGGKEQLRLITLKPKYVTCGYNTRGGSSFIRIDGGSMKGIVVRIHSFSINYADCCIRWGLYESANKFVGWPIVPGFDIAGVVEEVIGDHQEFKVGDKVFGVSPRAAGWISRYPGTMGLLTQT